MDNADKLMWSIIAQINWAARSKVQRGYEDGKEFILDNFEEGACRQLRLFVNDRHKELYERINVFENDHGTCGNYGGDDSFGDMINHVIGLGEEVYDMIMDNPKLLDRINYVESFGYCIPYEEDLLTPDESQELKDAKEVIRSLIATLEEDGQFGLDVVTDALDFLRRK